MTSPTHRAQAFFTRYSFIFSAMPSCAKDDVRMSETGTGDWFLPFALPLDRARRGLFPPWGLCPPCLSSFIRGDRRVVEPAAEELPGHGAGHYNGYDAVVEPGDRAQDVYERYRQVDVNEPLDRVFFRFYPQISEREVEDEGRGRNERDRSDKAEGIHPIKISETRTRCQTV